MLILTRRIGETVVIGEDIEISIVAINCNQVKIGVKAPKDVPVHRSEVYERIIQLEEARNGPRYLDSRLSVFCPLTMLLPAA